MSEITTFLWKIVCRWGKTEPSGSEEVVNNHSTSDQDWSLIHHGVTKYSDVDRNRNRWVHHSIDSLTHSLLHSESRSQGQWSLVAGPVNVVFLGRFSSWHWCACSILNSYNINQCLLLGTTISFIMVTVCLFFKKKEFINYRSKCKVYYYVFVIF